MVENVGRWTDVFSSKVFLKVGNPYKSHIHVRYTELSNLIRYIPPPVEYWRVYPKFHCFWNHKWQIKLHDHIKSLMSLNHLIIASVSQFPEVSCSPCNCCCQFPEFKHWLVTGLWAGRLLQQVVWAGQVCQMRTVRTNQSRVSGASWPMRGRVITSPGCTELPGAQVSQRGPVAPYLTLRPTWLTLTYYAMV